MYSSLTMTEKILSVNCGIKYSHLKQFKALVCKSLSNTGKGQLTKNLPGQSFLHFRFNFIIFICLKEIEYNPYSYV